VLAGIVRTEHGGATKWISYDLPTDQDPFDALVVCIAESIVSYRSRGMPQVLRAWRRVRSGGSPYDDVERGEIRALTATIFGRFDKPYGDDLLVAAVGEHLWYELSQADPELPIVRLESPKFHVTAPGADGLVVHRDVTLYFRLWEIKATLRRPSPTLREAYGQLTERATQYLAQYSTAGPQIADAELQDLYGNLSAAWQRGDTNARAGVAISTIKAPRRSFLRMRRVLQHLRSTDACRGQVSASSRLPEFAIAVRAAVWIGL